MKQNNIDIKWIAVDRLSDILPLIAELNPTISPEVLKKRLQDMISQNYKCIGCYLDQNLIGVCGIWIQTRFYCGKMIEPDNVYIQKEYQNLGLGQKLMNFIFEYGRENGCDVSELNCYIENDLGNAFWKKSGYKVIGYHQQKRL